MQSSRIIPSAIKSLVFDIQECENQGKLCFGYSLKKKQNQPQEMELMMNDFKRFDNVKYLRKYLFYKSNSDQYLFERPEQYSTLRSIIKPDEAIIIKIITDILVALYTLHQNQIFGRCFNIDNIIFVQGQYACLMEFGFFPAVDYQTPEEVSYQPLNEKLDVFHLGRVVYYLMVGKELPKYNMENFSELDGTINFDIVNTKYSQNLKLLTQALLNKDKTKRSDFMSLVEKFKANTQISQMSGFYSSKRQLVELVQKLEMQSQVRNQIFASSSNFQPEEKFPIIDTGHLIPITKTGQNQNVQFTMPQVQLSDNLLPPNSDDEFDDDNLFPPNIETTQPVSQNQLVRKYETYAKFTDVLPYFNKDLYQDLDIWNKIYFSFYRISIIKKLLQEIKNFQNLSDSFILHLTSFALNKIMVIIKKEINSAFQSCQNIFDIDPQQWKKFVTTEGFNLIKRSINQDHEISIKQFNSLVFPQLQISFKKFNQNLQTDSFINDRLDYPNFDSYKNDYRKILNNTLEFFEICQGSESPFIQLLVFFCILINKSFDLSLINTNFSNIATYIRENQIESFIDIERFLTLQNQSLFIDLKQQLIKTHFS